MVVPRQRPPARQGHLRRVRTGAGRHAGHLQRHAPVDEFTPRLDPLELALEQAAGHVPRHARGREVRHHDGHDRERHSGPQRLQQGFGRPRRRGAGEHRTDRGDRGLAGRVLRAVPLQRARRLCAEHHHGVRAGDADPAVLQPAAVRERVERVPRRPRDRPPVVRGRRVPQALEGHLDQRGVRAVRAVAVVRARGRGHGAGTRRLRVRLASGGRLVLDGEARGPGSGEPVRRGGLRPGRAGRPGAAQRDR